MRVCGLFGVEIEKRFYRGCPKGSEPVKAKKRGSRLIDFRSGTPLFCLCGFTRAEDKRRGSNRYFKKKDLLIKVK